MSSATFNGELANTGGETTKVYVCWGLRDAGKDPRLWDHCEPLGDRSIGSFSTALTGLSPNAIYFYRCFASNRLGVAWADGVEQIDSFTGPPVEGSTDLVLHWPMDQTSGDFVRDLSGRSNHGTLGGTYSWEAGVLGNSLRFTSSTPQPHAECLPLTTELTDYWSLSCWVKYGRRTVASSCCCRISRLRRRPVPIETKSDGYIYADGHKRRRRGLINSGWHHLAIVAQRWYDDHVP